MIVDLQQVQAPTSIEQAVPNRAISAGDDPDDYVVVVKNGQSSPTSDNTIAGLDRRSALDLSAPRSGSALAKPSSYVEGQPFVALEKSDDCDTQFVFNGKSWVITQKNIRTGVIQRFTQSGTGDRGRLEVIQGKGLNLPNGAPLPESASAIGRVGFSWVGVEDKGPAQAASHAEVPLPRSMRADVGSMLSDRGAPMGDALENLLPDSVRREMKRDQDALVAELNRRDQASPTAVAPAKPKARPAPPPAPL